MTRLESLSYSLAEWANPCLCSDLVAATRDSSFDSAGAKDLQCNGNGLYCASCLDRAFDRRIEPSVVVIVVTVRVVVKIVVTVYLAHHHSISFSLCTLCRHETVVEHSPVVVVEIEVGIVVGFAEGMFEIGMIVVVEVAEVVEIVGIVVVNVHVADCGLELKLHPLTLDVLLQAP